MLSLYSNVFRYRPRVNREPGEDFLTAALADLLNRLPRDQHIAFIADVLLDGVSATEWTQFLAARPSASLLWKTQRGVTYRNNRGIVDMVLFVAGRETLVVENKIAAPVRIHSPLKQNQAEFKLDEEDQKASAQKMESQLTTYSSWLAERCRHQHWPGALIYLTHLSEPPIGFLSADFGAPFTSICRWRDVWRWARGKKASIEKGRSLVGPAYAVLKNEFAVFLEGMDMSANGMTLSDLGRIEPYFEVEGRIDRSFGVVKELITHHKVDIGRGRDPGINYSSKMASIWSWFYLKEPKDSQWYVGWGIRFPEQAESWTEYQPPLPAVPHAFVTLGSDGMPIPIAQIDEGELVNGWVKLGTTELVVARKLHDFRPDSEGLAQDLALWVDESINAIRAVLEQLR